MHVIPPFRPPGDPLIARPLRDRAPASADGESIFRHRPIERLIAAERGRWLAAAHAPASIEHFSARRSYKPKHGIRKADRKGIGGKIDLYI